MAGQKTNLSINIFSSPFRVQYFSLKKKKNNEKKTTNFGHSFYLFYGFRITGYTMVFIDEILSLYISQFSGFLSFELPSF